MNIKGKITEFLDVESGTSKSLGKEWTKQSFLIDTESEWDNIICFDVFGEEKVANLTRFNKVGDFVDVKFGIKCNEWNGRYFTNLGAYRIDKVEEIAEAEVTEQEPINKDGKEDMPF